MNARLSPATLFSLIAGFFILCCLGLLFWIQGRPAPSLAPSPLVQITPTSTTETTPTSTERWVTRGKSFDVPDAIIKQQCLDVGCEQGWRIVVETKHDDKRHFILTKTLARPIGEPLQDAFQLGRLGDPNARLALTIPSLTYCDNELMGCGPTFILRLADLEHPERATILESSEWLPQHQMVWSPDYRYALGLNGVCEGGCRPEPLIIWNIETGTTTQATVEDAYINTEHYDGDIRGEGEVKPAYRYWMNLHWLDTTRFAADLIDASNTKRIITGTVR